MTLTMQDSDITSGFTVADAYAAYVLSDTGEGHNNYAATVARFPGKIVLSICTRFNATADILDYESGTTGTGPTDWNQAVAWVQRMRAAGRVCAVYCNLSTKPELVAAFAAAGVVMTADDWWIAHWTNVPHFEGDSNACQYGGTSGYDLSVVTDEWPARFGGEPPMTPDEMAQVATLTAQKVWTFILDPNAINNGYGPQDLLPPDPVTGVKPGWPPASSAGVYLAALLVEMGLYPSGGLLTDTTTIKNSLATLSAGLGVTEDAGLAAQLTSIQTSLTKLLDLAPVDDSADVAAAVLSVLKALPSATLSSVVAGLSS